MLRFPGHLAQVKPGQQTARQPRALGSTLLRPRPLLCSGNSLSSCQRAVASPGRSNVAHRGPSPSLSEGPAAVAHDVGELLLRRWIGVDQEGHLPVYEVRSTHNCHQQRTNAVACGSNEPLLPGPPASKLAGTHAPARASCSSIAAWGAQKVVLQPQSSMATLPPCCCCHTQETAPLRDTDCSVTVCATLVTAGQRKHVLLAVIVSDTAGSSTARRPGSSSFTVADLAQPSLHWGCCPGQGDRWQEPPSGWSTWPDVSHDARECPTPGIGLQQVHLGAGIGL